MHCLPAHGHQVDLLLLARLEADAGGGGDVEAQAEGLSAVELERPVHLEEVEVGTHLDGAVAGVAHLEGRTGRPALISMSPSARTSPPTGTFAATLAMTHLVDDENASSPFPRESVEPESFDRFVDRDQSTAVGEDRLDLHKWNHLGDSVHDVLRVRTVAAIFMTSSSVLPAVPRPWRRR